jgi:hypothetical protein
MIKCRSCEDPTLVFVFGSNESGIHGAGAAEHAENFHGAISGQAFGYQHNCLSALANNSAIRHSFAIPTKDPGIFKRLRLKEIEAYIRAFKRFALYYQTLRFDVTRIGCGLAGYEDKDIAPFFLEHPSNVILPQEWVDYLNANTEYNQNPNFGD